MKGYSHILFLLFSACFWAVRTPAQWNGNLETVKAITVDLSSCKPLNKFKSVRSVAVEDRRPDSSCIGFDARLSRERYGTVNMLITRSCSKLITAGGLPAQLENCFQKCVVPSGDSSYAIKIIIREFWLNNLLNIYNKAYVPNSIFERDMEDPGGIIIKADIFLSKGNQFIPIKKIDTLLEVAQFSRTDKATLIASGLDLIVSAVNLSSFHKYYNFSKNVVSTASADSFCNSGD